MLLICFGKPGVDLYRTLSDSETSRHILRFYHPKELEFGISVEVSTVSSGLALMSELRWYIMRYMREVLIEDTDHGVYLTQNLAREAYDSRSITLSPEWESRFRICVTEEGDVLRLPEGVPEPEGVAGVYAVWGLPDEHP
ncbi:DUF5804 family protein [Methanocorpusculum sp. MG]|uniref:DUF5804 family protein n=1 Tax=Methanocorpusculum petauri TaxID=3002863 RepID=A0ABT4IER0_9EURY|nr:DUF5804 family protein [Methanocorpusculum petauri]MCZ0859608.1 DUF5804 family protein [Methanocorpusculum petauri]MDE2443390.1 DUF5804 family protein [Methanocorpusculum sp.]